MAIVLQAKAQDTKLHIMVDERMELLTTIQYLSGYPILTQADIKYKKEIDSYFKDYKEHDAVLLNKKIYRRFFGFDAPPTYICYFSFPDFKQVAPFSQEDLDAYEFDKNSDTLALLLHAFKDFYQKTRFHEFYTAHKHFYDSLIKPVANKIGPTNAIDIMEEHYGQKNKAYNIILCPLMNDGGYGPQIKTPGGQVLYAIIGPKSGSKDIPEFDIDYLLSDYVIHEFSHSFCNPLISKNLAHLQQDSCLFRQVRAAMKEQGYGSWAGCLYEHFVRANEVILTEKITGKTEADAAYDDMVKNGQWIYLEGLTPVIRRYVAGRKKYKTEDAIMPLVIAYFNKKAHDCK